MWLFKIYMIFWNTKFLKKKKKFNKNTKKIINDIAAVI